MKLIHFNVVSILGSFDDLEAYLHKLGQDFDAIVRTETWLSEEKSHLASLDGYKATHVTRKINRADGVTIFVKNSLNFEVIETRLVDASGLTVKIKVGNTKLLLTGIYRTPSISNLNGFLDSLEELVADCGDFTHIILGDFNIDILAKSVGQCKYEGILLSGGYQRLIHEMTRPNLVNGGGTCLDHAYLRNVKVKSRGDGVIIKDFFKDHYPVVVNYLSNDEVKIGPSLKDRVKVVYDKMSNLLLNYNWSNFYKLEHVEDCRVKLPAITKEGCLDPG